MPGRLGQHRRTPAGYPGAQGRVGKRSEPNPRYRPPSRTRGARGAPRPRPVRDVRRSGEDECTPDTDHNLPTMSVPRQEAKSETLIIAEAGVNHNGDINLARKLIDVAANAGANRAAARRRACLRAPFSLFPSGLTCYEISKCPCRKFIQSASIFHVFIYAIPIFLSRIDESVFTKNIMPYGLPEVYQVPTGVLAM